MKTIYCVITGLKLEKATFTKNEGDLQDLKRGPWLTASEETELSVLKL